MNIKRFSVVLVDVLFLRATDEMSNQVLSVVIVLLKHINRSGNNH